MTNNIESKEVMNEKNDLDKALKDFKKYFLLILLWQVIMLGVMTYWIIDDEFVIDLAENLFVLKESIKMLHRHTAYGIFISCLILIIISSIQVLKLYKIVFLLNEQIKNNKTNS